MIWQACGCCKVLQPRAMLASDLSAREDEKDSIDRGVQVVYPPIVKTESEGAESMCLSFFKDRPRTSHRAFLSFEGQPAQFRSSFLFALSLSEDSLSCQEGSGEASSGWKERRMRCLRNLTESPPWHAEILRRKNRQCKGKSASSKECPYRSLSFF